MKCRYCLVEFHAETFTTTIHFHQQPRFTAEERSVDVSYFAATQVCSSCLGAHITILENAVGRRGVYTLVHPQTGAADPPPVEVPETIAQDYREASHVLLASPKAAAALARRCMQAILSAHGYKGRNLLSQVESVLAETDASKALPTSLRENIDVIRNFGNFSAHPITDQSTLQIIDVEEGEAEWCLQILQDMFDHYYVAPAKAAIRRTQLAQKLSAAGKPPMKG